ncbi:MAG: FGGY-family carbohydrate kinase [Bacteroidales bacterium]|jgi:sugar (pentulose or hexulose) kinase|nr:FGGY-family carbohydrate kinase [Bacteroidales bacterium]
MKTSDELILSIDFGTQSVRAVIFDLSGNITRLARTEIEPYFSVGPGMAEQHPEYFRDRMFETLRKLFSEAGSERERIKAVSITTQRSTLVNLDKDGNSLRPAISWLDQRQTAPGKYPGKLMQLALRVVGMRESVVYSVKNGECNWIMQHTPEIWQRTDKYLLLSGYLTFVLTGEFSDSIGCTVGYVPFDFKKQEWASESHMNFKMFPVEREKLPRLVKPAGILGYISKDASEKSGIPQGLPLIASAADKACEVLGSGVISPDVACLSYGTTSTVQTTHRKYFEVIPFFPAYPSAIPDHYNTEIMIFRGYWMINWFKKEFGLKETQIAEKTGRSPEELFDEMISTIPAGSMGLTLQPYWSPGLKTPGTEAKGAIIGFGDVHTRAHIYRAILEGLAYSLREGLERTVKRTGIGVRKIIVSGGGSQSNQAMQITADIFNMATFKPHIYETSSLGAAINAAVGMKFYSDYDSAVSAMTRQGEEFLPDSRNVEIYNELYSKVYSRMYRHLQPLYSQIRNITGYPQKI